MAVTVGGGVGGWQGSLHQPVVAPDPNHSLAQVLGLYHFAQLLDILAFC